MIELTGFFEVVEEYNGKTIYEFWKNIKVGDKIEIKVTVSGSYGAKESRIIHYKTTGEKIERVEYLGEIGKYLNKFKLIQMR